MAATVHMHTFSPQVNQWRIDPAVSGSLVSMPLTKSTVGVWDASDHAFEPISLVGHRRPVSAISFSHSEPKLLCSASEDSIIVWNVRKCQHNFAKGDDVRGLVALSNPGSVSCVCFSPSAELLAVCVESVVNIVTISQAKITAELSGHLAKITGAEFCPHYLSTLVSVSDDRTFKVWNVNRSSLIYQSTVIASTPLISLCMNRLEPQVAIGTAGGIIKVFDLFEGNNFRQLFQLDVSKMLLKRRQNEHKKCTDAADSTTGPSSKRHYSSPSSTGDTDCYRVESSNSVLSLFYLHSTENTKETDFDGKAHSAVGKVLASVSPVLAVATSNCLFQVDSRTLEMLVHIDLQEPMSSIAHREVREITVGAIGLAAVGQTSSGHLLSILSTLFETRVHCMVWPAYTKPLSYDRSFSSDYNSDTNHIKFSEGTNNSEIHNSFSLKYSECRIELSMVARKPLTENSPLKSEIKLQSKSTSSHIKNARKKANPMNQPLTFKTTVKSSGYTEAPRHTMFQPRINVRSKSHEISKCRTSSGEGLSGKMASQEYPLDAGPPAEVEERISTGISSTSITYLQFSSDGKHLACSLSNTTTLVYAAPFGKKESSVFVGHKNTVNSVSWSHNKKYILTSSADKSANLWDKTTADILLTFSSFSSSVKHGQAEVKTKPNASYTKEVQHAQFFYMDKFILIIVGNQLCLYKYHIDSKKDDIRRYASKNHYKIVQQWDTSSQNFTALSAVNSFHSHLTLCAGSNRDIEIYDMNEGRLVHIFEDVHSKPVHSITINEGSAYTSQPQDAFNVFATSSTLDCIKLWDVRTKGHVLRLEGHTNNAHGCGIAFSPCGTYLGSGSEDKVAYVYDLRTGTYCQKLRGHTDVVSAMTFHPARPLLASGSIDGKIFLFKPA